MAEKKDQTGRVDLGWGQTFSPMGAYPLIAKQIYNTKADAEDYAKTDTTAYVGAVIVVVNDTDDKNNGVYYVHETGSTGGITKAGTNVDITNVYIFQGSVDALPAYNTSMKVGWVYNTNTEIELDGKKYPIGTNFAISGLDASKSTVTWDALSGIMDLSNYVTNTKLNTELSKKQDIIIKGKNISINDDKKTINAIGYNYNIDNRAFAEGEDNNNKIYFILSAIKGQNKLIYTNYNIGVNLLKGQYYKIGDIVYKIVDIKFIEQIPQDKLNYNTYEVTLNKPWEGQNIDYHNWPVTVDNTIIEISEQNGIISTKPFYEGEDDVFYFVNDDYNTIVNIWGPSIANEDGTYTIKEYSGLLPMNIYIEQINSFNDNLNNHYINGVNLNENISKWTLETDPLQIVYIKCSIKNIDLFKTLTELYSDETCTTLIPDKTINSTSITTEKVKISEPIPMQFKEVINYYIPVCNLALGKSSHTEGGEVDVYDLGRKRFDWVNTVALGESSHAEGICTIAGEDKSHYAAHAEGVFSQALAEGAHAEGGGLIIKDGYWPEHLTGGKALGAGSHAEGGGTISGKIITPKKNDFEPICDHAEGFETIAEGSCSHAQNASNIAKGVSSSAGGYLNIVKGHVASSTGISNLVTGFCSYSSSGLKPDMKSAGYIESIDEANKTFTYIPSNDNTYFLEQNKYYQLINGEHYSHWASSVNENGCTVQWCDRVYGNFKVTKIVKGDAINLNLPEQEQKYKYIISYSEFNKEKFENQVNFFTQEKHLIIEAHPNDRYIKIIIGGHMSPGLLLIDNVYYETTANGGSGYSKYGRYMVVYLNKPWQGPEIKKDIDEPIEYDIAWTPATLFSPMINIKGDYSHSEGYYNETNNLGEHAEGKYNLSIPNFSQHTIGIGTEGTIDNPNLNRKNAILVSNNGKVYINGIGGYTGTESTIIADGENSKIDGVNDLKTIIDETLQITPQTLTADQQAQVRTNINTMSREEIMAAIKKAVDDAIIQTINGNY